jgi:hypothetical protein
MELCYVQTAEAVDMFLRTLQYEKKKQKYSKAQHRTIRSSTILCEHLMGRKSDHKASASKDVLRDA